MTPAPTVESSAEPEVSVPSAPLLSAAKKTGVPEPAYIEERSLVRRRQDSIQSQIEFSDFFMQREQEERECLQDMVFVLGLVTRVVDLNSREVQESLGAQKAIDRERQNLVKKEALPHRTVDECEGLVCSTGC